MDPLSVFFSVMTLGRILNTFVLGFIVGRIFKPSKFESYKLAFYLLAFILLGFGGSFVAGDLEGIVMSVSNIALWVICNAGLLLGQFSHKVKIYFLR